MLAAATAMLPKLIKPGKLAAAYSPLRRRRCYDDIRNKENRGAVRYVGCVFIVMAALPRANNGCCLVGARLPALAVTPRRGCRRSRGAPQAL